MSMVEVDPKLFIKCRLCLEDSGTYQIVPTVRELISYCFDINVEPFDGLPQLICKKCQSILSDYSKAKKSFIDKQKELKILRVQENNSQKEVVKLEKHDLAVKRENIDPVDKYETYSSKRRKESAASSANEFEYNRDPINQIVDRTSNEEFKKKDWKKKYQKIFSCRLCSSHCYSKKSATRHSSNHRNLKSEHIDVFDKYCVVQLHKVDSKPNITGSIDQVVYSKNKIIAKGNPDYYIAYTSKKSIQSSDNEDIPGESINAAENSDSSSRSNGVVVRRRRRRRICSRSSNETVVLENKSDKSSRNSQENECINIDDTDSDDEKTEIQREKRNITKKSLNVIKHSIVAKLINTTYSKFLKKHEQPEKPSLEQLSRKIISIGRQIINKRGFNCARLKKYIDHLNLDIIWLSRSPLNVTSNSNYFKIISRARYNSEKNINDFEGYKKKYGVLEIQSRTSNLEQETGVEEESNIVETSSVLKGILENQGIFSETVNTVSENDTSRTSFAPELESAMLYSITAPNTKKLLNAHPAANPRQLRKFTTGPKSYQDRARASKMLTLEVNPLELSSVVTTEHENNIQMPIITYTTSLAVPQADITPVNNETLNNNSTKIGNPEDSKNESQKPTGPRIKVKSVTELMSQETLNRMNDPSVVETPNLQITLNGSESNVFGASQNNLPSISEDYVILHTVELPNTKTSSPFRYFRMLLQVHNLTLLDTDAFLTAEFHTLIRFKVLYKQELKDQPVVLSLSLFCSHNVFCLKIKDRNEDNINMTKISANWQWEILKIYTGEVVTKLLNNARKISPDMYDKTNSFLCLLKSITFIPR